VSYSGISNLRPQNYFVAALTCLYCGRTPTGDYDNCDYCGALVRRGQRIEVTTIADKAPRYIEVEGQ
jgi:hypothetical protein